MIVWTYFAICIIICTYVLFFLCVLRIHTYVLYVLYLLYMLNVEYVHVFSLCSGLAQCAELCWQLRGEAGPRQVPSARIALQHNIGLGGAVIVGLYKLGFPHYARTGSSKRNISAVGISGGEPRCTVVFDEIEKRLKTVSVSVQCVHTAPIAYVSAVRVMFIMYRLLGA